MAQISKMEVQIEIKSSADKFYDAFRNKMHIMPKICPQHFKDGKLIEGDGKSVGSVRVWTYFSEGEIETVKETIEAIDDKNKTITFNLLEGDMMKYYKSYKPIINVTASGQENLVKWTIEYEKQSEGVPEPVKYKDFVAPWSQTIDAYLLAEQKKIDASLVNA